MRMGQPLRHLFSCEIDDVARQLPEDDDPLWDRFSMRQKRFRAHSRTRSIVFSFTDVWLGEAPAVMRLGYAPTGLTEAVEACGRRLIEHYGGGRILRLLVTNLPAGAAIPRHVDSGFILEATHRCHIAIETSPAVTFAIDDVDYHLPAGEAYEVDNMRPHAVMNAGEGRRVHLICNILPEPKPATQSLS